MTKAFSDNSDGIQASRRIQIPPLTAYLTKHQSFSTHTICPPEPAPFNSVARVGHSSFAESVRGSSPGRVCLPGLVATWARPWKMAPPDIAMAGVSPAGYGRSCINCSRSKTKCIVRPRSDVCERCCRLKKDCQPMATSRKRTMKKPPSSKTAQLEEKIDDLVSILRASQQASQPSSQTSSTPESTPSQRAFPSRLDSLAAAATSTTPQTRPQPTPASHFPVPIISISKDACDLLMKPSEADFPTPEEAEAYLDKFRGWLRNFPFMHIPHNQSAESLRLEKPFLFKCIMGISTMSIRQLHKIRDDLRKEAAQRVVVEHERSLDLLLGLICYVAW